MHAHTPTPEQLAWNPPLWWDLFTVAFLLVIVAVVGYTILTERRL